MRLVAVAALPSEPVTAPVHADRLVLVAEARVTVVGCTVRSEIIFDDLCFDVWPSTHIY